MTHQQQQKGNETKAKAIQGTQGKQDTEPIPNMLFYSGKWNSTVKEYAGKVDVRYDRKHRYAKVQFVVENASGAARLVLPYRKVLKMYEEGTLHHHEKPKKATAKDTGKEAKEAKATGKEIKINTNGSAKPIETKAEEAPSFPKLTGELMGVTVTFSLDPACTIASEKLHGTYKSRGTLLDDDGKFAVKRVTTMDEKTFKESTKCSIM